jgi:hypothetical protein
MWEETLCNYDVCITYYYYSSDFCESIDSFHHTEYIYSPRVIIILFPVLFLVLMLFDSRNIYLYIYIFLYSKSVSLFAHTTIIPDLLSLVCFLTLSFFLSFQLSIIISLYIDTSFIKKKQKRRFVWYECLSPSNIVPCNA